jgi:chromosome partitioning protein
MTRQGITAPLAALTVVSGTIAAVGPPALAQDGRERAGGDRVQPPTELLREYPFRQGRLRSRERSQPAAARARGRGRAAPASVDDSSPDFGTAALVIALAVMAATVLLLALSPVTRRVARAVAGARRPQPAEPEALQADEPGPGVPEPPWAPPEPESVEPSVRPSRFQRPQRLDGQVANAYAVVNQKGGVGKTTVSLTLGAAAARRGKTVLVVDLDPQASATMVLAGGGDGRSTVADIMREPPACSLGDTITATAWGLDLAPADRSLRRADTGLAVRDEPVLARELNTVGDYDLVLIDCPPSLGALTIDALTAVPHALVVTEPTFLALQAMEELLDTLRDVAAIRNPSLELAGVVVNRVEATAEHKRSVAELEDAFGSQVWQPHIPKRAALQDAMRCGMPPQDLRTHYTGEIVELFDALAQQLQPTRTPL